MKIKSQEETVAAERPNAKGKPREAEPEREVPSTVKLRDFVRLFRREKVESGCYAFNLKFRYSSRLAMYKGYDPDNDMRVQFDSYEQFIETLPDLYVRSVDIDIGGPNTWCERITVSLHERDYDPKTGRTPMKVQFRN